MEVLNDFTSESVASLVITKNEINNTFINSDWNSQAPTSSQTFISTQNYSVNDNNYHKHWFYFYKNGRYLALFSNKKCEIYFSTVELKCYWTNYYTKIIVLVVMKLTTVLQNDINIHGEQYI